MRRGQFSAPAAVKWAVGDETQMIMVIRRFGRDRKRKKMPDAQSLNAIRTALGQRSVVLVGLMGCGKSAIGRRLAAKLGLPFVDADEEIEKAAGKNIEDIFADHGEPYFREGERKVLARLLRSGPQVLATGGGAFMNEETRVAIAENGVSVWLRAELPLLVRRVGKRGNRPLLKNGDPETVLQNLIDDALSSLCAGRHHGREPRRAARSDRRRDCRKPWRKSCRAHPRSPDERHHCQPQGRADRQRAAWVAGPTTC